MQGRARKARGAKARSGARRDDMNYDLKARESRVTLSLHPSVPGRISGQAKFLTVDTDLLVFVDFREGEILCSFLH